MKKEIFTCYTVINESPQVVSSRSQSVTLTFWNMYHNSNVNFKHSHYLTETISLFLVSTDFSAFHYCFVLIGLFCLFGFFLSKLVVKHHITKE